MVQPTNSVRSATADEGIRLLKQGVAVTKYGRTGQPHKEKLLLSADERSLGWAGHIASKLMGSSKLLSPKAKVVTFSTLKKLGGACSELRMEVVPVQVSWQAHEEDLYIYHFDR